MTGKDQFTEEEWTAIMLLPIQVISAGTFADGRKLISSVREMAAGAKALSELSAKYPDNAIVAGFQEGASGTHKLPGAEHAKSTEDVINGLLAETEKAWAILRSKTTDEEAAQCREVLIGVETAVVSATGSGMLGFGGEKVSAAEQSVLDRVTAILSA